MTTVFLKADPKKKRSKYKNVGVKDPKDGYFHSGSEHTRWKELQLLQRAGKISGLKRQVPFDLIVNGAHVGIYIADYVYLPIDRFLKLADGTALFSPIKTEWSDYIIEDRKGGKAKTAARQVFEIKRKLMKACHGIDILITGKGT